MSTSMYSLEWILPFVRAALQATSTLDYRNFAIAVWMRLEAAGIPGVVRAQHVYSNTIFDFDHSPNELRQATSQAFFYLIHHGYIALQPPDSTLNYPSGHMYDVTPRGHEWFNGGEPYPEEAVSYLTLLRQFVPGLDTVIEQYVVEALTAFEREAHFAAAVMLGAASEKAIYLLAESLIGAVADTIKKKKLKTILEGRSLLRLLELVRDSVQVAGKANLIPYPHFEGSATHLMSLFEAIRVQRNDAVHPMNATVSSASVRHLLKAFPYALAKSEELRRWFDANPDSV